MPGPLRAVPLAALAVALAGTACAQPAPEPETVAVPLPETGVFYYRAGSTGGVVVRAGQPARTLATETARRLARRTAGDGADRLGLSLLERSVLDALDRRLAGLDVQRRRSLGLPPAPPVVVVPGQRLPGRPVESRSPIPVEEA